MSDRSNQTITSSAAKRSELTNSANLDIQEDSKFDSKKATKRLAEGKKKIAALKESLFGKGKDFVEAINIELDTSMSSPKPKLNSEVVLHGKKRDVIVIGAGLSGLVAAKELRAHGVDVLVLEARNRVGGRTLTKREPADGKETGLWVDLGGSYVGPTQDSLLNLMDELKLETYLVEDSQDTGYLRVDSNGRPVHRARLKSGRDPPLGNNPIVWLDYVNMVRLIDRLGAQIPSDAPWLAPEALDWDSKSYKQFVDEHGWTKRAKDFFTNVHCTIDVCCNASEVSMLWMLWYIKQCGGFGRTIATTNGGQERKIKGGTQQLSERLVELLGRDRLLLARPVSRLDQSSGHFVQVSTLDGAQFRADRVICALPPHLLLKIHHEPALPATKNLLAQRSPMGMVAKVILYYKRPFWREHNYSGCFIVDSGKRSAQPVILSLDDTKPDGSHPAVVGFTGAQGWWAMRDLSDQEVGHLVAESYVQASQLTEFRDFLRVLRFDWTGEQYSGGCYTSTHTMGTLTKFGEHLREPFGLIHYAGTETATKWSGYMDGAVSAGKRAARELLHARGKLDEELVWQSEPENVNLPPRPFQYPWTHDYAPSIEALIKRTGQLAVVSGLIALLVWKRPCLSLATN